MISILRYIMSAVLCSAVFVTSVTAKDAPGLHDDTRIKETPNRPSPMKTIRGRVTQSDDNSVTVEQVNGEEIVLTIDSQTKLNKKNLYPGDRITATVTHEGRAAVVLKAGKGKPNHNALR